MIAVSALPFQASLKFASNHRENYLHSEKCIDNRGWSVQYYISLQSKKIRRFQDYSRLVCLPFLLHVLTENDIIDYVLQRENVLRRNGGNKLRIYCLYEHTFCRSVL